MRRSFLFVATLIFCALPLSAQSAWRPKDKGLNLPGAHAANEWVSLQSTPNMALSAGHLQTVAISFRIQDGLHVNSHTPRAAYLIPTTLTLDAPVGLHITHLQYPQATEYHFPFAPKDSLLVYTGLFPVNVTFHAKAGSYTVPGKLHYQSCDHQTCNPPKTLLFTLHVTAK